MLLRPAPLQRHRECLFTILGHFSLLLSHLAQSRHPLCCLWNVLHLSHYSLSQYLSSHLPPATRRNFRCSHCSLGLLAWCASWPLLLCFSLEFHSLVLAASLPDFVLQRVIPFLLPKYWGDPSQKSVSCLRPLPHFSRPCRFRISAGWESSRFPDPSSSVCAYSHSNLPLHSLLLDQLLLLLSS